MLYSITPEGKLKIHRDLSKWRSKQVGKRHAIYFSEAPSAQEARDNAEIQRVISKAVRECTLEQDASAINATARKQALRDSLA